MNLHTETASVQSVAWLEGFAELARGHKLWRHPFIDRCRGGTLSLEQVRLLAVQMYKFSYEFNAILARAIAACDDESARIIVAENLWEELGSGDLGSTHPALFRRFTRALGISDVALAAVPALPETRALIHTYLTLPDSHGFLAAVAAVCFASEGIVAMLYRQIEQGIRGTVAIADEDLAFFHVHIQVDDSHAANLVELLGPRLSTAEDALLARSAIRLALDARCTFFDGILRATRTPCDS
ncbi:MAG TPA: iron-containing redox enzyme family protein [Polyangia bacterium]|jgi:pyrroloquinoline-quinone synthase|nr:iron-containing redox enzyme family protein [Polyangia bacterium]